MALIRNNTYTNRDEGDDGADGRVRAYPDNRQTMYPTATGITRIHNGLPTISRRNIVDAGPSHWCRSMEMVCLIGWGS